MNAYAEIRIGPETSVGADTERDWYTKVLLPGKWQITSVYWVPHDAVIADATNHTVFTLTNATASQTIATRSYAATNSVAGTPEAQTTPSGKAAEVASGDVIKLAKTDPGTGLAARGHFVLLLEHRPIP